jgi:hypothetical protein
MLKRPFLIGSIFLLLFRTASAQNREQIYREGLDALYNLEFAVAEKHFRQLTALEPENPSTWNHVASALWLKIVAEQEKLNLESFSGASLGTNDSKDAVSPQAEKELRETIAISVSKADALLMRNEKDVHALYAKGVAKGILAAFEGVAKRSYVSAYRAGREARDLHSRVLKYDPNYKDAALTIGLYDYALGSIPGWFRLFLGVFGVSGGNKARGLATVADVAAHGSQATIDAKMLLVVMYNREKQYQDSLAILSDLHARYPRNYLLELSKAALHSRLQQWDQSITTYTAVLNKAEAGNEGYKKLEAPKILLLLAKAYLDKSAVPEAMGIYNQIISDARSSDTDRANAHLWLGRLYDLMKDRPRALVHYDAILSSNCKPGIKEEAQKYKKTPFAG